MMEGLTFSELFFSGANFPAVASTNAEATLLSGNLQPRIKPGYFNNAGYAGKSLSFLARGIISVTSTPTIQFQWRLSSTQGTTTYSGGSIGISAAITTLSGVSTKWWEARLDLLCTTPGSGTNNATLQASGYVHSPNGFASPFLYPVEITTPESGTWTQTFDDALAQWVNLSVTWGTSSSSNTITLKSLRCFAEN